MATIEATTPTTTATSTDGSPSKKKKIEKHTCNPKFFPMNVFDERMDYITANTYSLMNNNQLVDWKHGGDFFTLTLLHMHVLANVVKNTYQNYCASPKLCSRGDQTIFCESEHCMKDNPNCIGRCDCNNFCEICAFVKPYYSLEKSQEEHWCNVNFYEPRFYRDTIRMYAYNMIPRYVRNVMNAGHDQGNTFNCDLNEMTIARAGAYFQYNGLETYTEEMKFLKFMIHLINGLDDHYKPLYEVQGSYYDQNIIKGIMEIEDGVVVID